jgi:hypothetical protein
MFQIHSNPIIQQKKFIVEDTDKKETLDVAGKIVVFRFLGIIFLLHKLVYHFAMFSSYLVKD